VASLSLREEKRDLEKVNFFNRFSFFDFFSLETV
jgi:hypothetical protein